MADISALSYWPLQVLNGYFTSPRVRQNTGLAAPPDAAFTMAGYVSRLCHHLIACRCRSLLRFSFDGVMAYRQPHDMAFHLSSLPLPKHWAFSISVFIYGSIFIDRWLDYYIFFWLISLLIIYMILFSLLVRVTFLEQRWIYAIAYLKMRARRALIT